MAFTTYDVFTATNVSVPTGTAVTLLSLLRAKRGKTVNDHFPEATLQNDPDQNSGAGNGSILIGDSHLTTSDYGTKIQVGGTFTIRGSDTAVDLANIYVVASGGTAIQLNFMGRRQ